MSSNTNTTIQSSADSITSRINDRKLEQALGYIYSNKNLGLQVRTFAANTIATLDVSDSVCISQASLGLPVTLTLPHASAWSTRDTTKSPFIEIIGTGASSGTTTIAVQSGDTLNGSSTIAGGNGLILISDGATNWYSFATIASGAYVSKSGDTMTGQLLMNTTAGIGTDTIWTYTSSGTNGLVIHGTSYPGTLGTEPKIEMAMPATNGAIKLTARNTASLSSLTLQPAASASPGTFNWSGGNVAFNATLGSWSASFQVIQLATQTSIGELSGDTYYINNGIWNSGWRYQNTNPAALFQQSQGKHEWFYAASGTAGTALSWSTLMQSDTNGRLGIGAAPSTARLHVAGLTGDGLRINMNTNQNHIILAEAGADRWINYITSSRWKLWDANNAVDRIILDPSSIWRIQLNGIGGRTLIMGNSEAFALAVTYNNTTGGPVYFGATDATGTPGFQISAASGGPWLLGTYSDASLTKYGALIHGGVPEVAQGASSTPIATADTYLSFKQGSVGAPSSTMTYETPAIYVERHTNNPSSAAYSNHSNLQLSGAITSEVVAYANEWGSPNCFVGRVQSNFPIPTNTVFSISSLTQTGGTATAVTTVAHGYSTGWQVVVSGASPAGYDGTVTITVVNSTTFTYSVSSGLTSPATGTITVQKSPTTPNGLVGITTMALSQATSGTHRDTWGANFTADFNNTGAAKPANCVGIEVDVLPGISSASSADNYSGFWAQTSGRGLGIVANAAFMSTQTAGGGWNYGLLMDGVIKSILISTATNTITSGIDISSYAYSSYHIKTPSFGVQNTGFGYITGGGTVVQGTSKSTAVTQNALCGTIQTTTSALAAGTIVSFQFNNSNITANDVLVLNHHGGGTPGSYTLEANCGAGIAIIFIRNNTAGSLSEALLIRYAIIKGA